SLGQMAPAMICWEIACQTEFSDSVTSGTRRTEGPVGGFGGQDEKACSRNEPGQACCLSYLGSRRDGYSRPANGCRRQVADCRERALDREEPADLIVSDRNSGENFWKP